MANGRVATLGLLVVSLALPFGPAAAQSRFTTPAQQAGDMRFRDMDRNNDGVITRQEWRGSERSFRVHDWNGDGILSGEEVRPGARRGGWSPEDRRFDSAVADGDRAERFRVLDANGNGRIERIEWQGSLDAFEWLDRDSDGTLSRAEVVGSAARRAQAREAASSDGEPCTSNAAQVVDDIYQQVLQRSADPSSAPLTQGLAAGQLTVRDIVARLAKSDEHTLRFFWQPVVSAIYQRLLDREPSESEMRDVSTGMASGRLPMAEVVARTAASGLSNDEEGVRRLYRRLLGREADAQGLRAYVDMARHQGIDAAARSISQSPEYSQRVGMDFYEPAVRSMYRRLLGRDPDPQGLQDLARVAAGGNVDALVDRLVSSAEYERQYGRDVVPGRGARYCA